MRHAAFLLIATVHSLQLQLQLPDRRDAHRAPPPLCKAPRVPLRELTEGSEWEGMVSKITDFGCFVRMGHEQHMGLVHVSSLASERMEKEDVRDFVEQTVGPVGSKVRVLVLGMSFKGNKRVSLQLLDVISRQQMEDIVFARPRDSPPEETAHPGVDRYNDLEPDDDLPEAEELADWEGDDEEDDTTMGMGDDFDDDEFDDEIEGELLVLAGSEDVDDNLRALEEAGIELADGLSIENVSE